MNFLFSFNKKYFLYLSLVIFFSFIIFLVFQFSFNKSKSTDDLNLISKVDITEPRFSINSTEEKILVTAREGNFIDTDKILLKKDVLFESYNFMIESDNVIFDRIKQTATSQEKSVFKAKKTKISSEGFDIYDNGNKIKFYGKSTLILK